MNSKYLIRMILTALTAAVFCVVSPITIPIGPIPLSLMTLVLYVSIYVTGRRITFIACVLYLLIGMAGLPVFSLYQGGIGKLAGPTGGYLIGYLPMILIGGAAIAMGEKSRKKISRVLQALGLIVATAVLYVLGTVWFVISSGTPVGAALMICVVPFLPGDLVKIVISVIVGPEFRKRIRRFASYSSK